MTAILIAHSLDLVTFFLAAGTYGIGGEANPLARWAFALAGYPGIVALKVAGVGFVLYFLAGFPDTFGKSVAIGIIAGLGILGALSNLYAYSLAR